jgi:hypothetical protein
MTRQHHTLKILRKNRCSHKSENRQREPHSIIISLESIMPFLIKNVNSKKLFQSSKKRKAEEKRLQQHAAAVALLEEERLARCKSGLSSSSSNSSSITQQFSNDEYNFPDFLMF